ncbi:Rho GTPase activation protein [Chytridium lagenaria]|nr:Rho GTPase activation protein [Chytridium lagenaria]
MLPDETLAEYSERRHGTFKDFLKSFESKKRVQVNLCLDIDRKLNTAGMNLQKAKQELDAARHHSYDTTETLVRAQTDHQKKREIDRLIHRSTTATDRVETLTKLVLTHESEFNNLRNGYAAEVEPVNKALREIEEMRQVNVRKALGDLNFLESVAVGRVANAEVLTDDPVLNTSLLPRNTIFSGPLRLRKGDNLSRPWVPSEIAMTPGFLYILGNQSTSTTYSSTSNPSTPTLIPLAEGSVQVSTVDDSYFQTPWCFQVIASDTNGGKRSVLNFAAGTADDRDMWMYHLRMYSTCCAKCLGFYRDDGGGSTLSGVTSPSSSVASPSNGVCSPSNNVVSPTVTGSMRSGMVRSLQLWVTEAKELVGVPAGKCNTYCEELCQERAITVLGEEYRFSDISPCKTRLRLIIFQSGLSNRDHEIGYVSINLNSLKTGKRHEDWYPIKKFGKANDDDSTSAGSIRISYILLACQTLPTSSYQIFIETITEPTLLCARTIAPLLTHERDELCKTLLNVLTSLSLEVTSLKSLTAAEIVTTDDPNIIFRGNSIATKMLDQYMKIVGMGYLHGTIGALVKGVYEARESCEVDPCKIGAKGVEKDSEQLKRRWKRLMNHVNAFWDAISQSSEKCPIELVLIFSHMRAQLRAKFQDERYVWAGISGFIFLRFFCPAILSPKLFNIMPEHPDPQTLRTLTLIAKILQNLANLSEFEGKEPHMEPTNEWLANHAPDMRHFINSISSMSANAPVPLTTRSRLDLRRDAAALHNFFSAHITEMSTKSSDPIITTLKEQVDTITLAIVKCKELEESTHKKNSESPVRKTNFKQESYGICFFIGPEAACATDLSVDAACKAENCFVGFTNARQHGQNVDEPFLEYRDSLFSDCQPLGPKALRENTQQGKKNSVDTSEGRRHGLGGSKLTLFKKTKEKETGEGLGFSLRSLLQGRNKEEKGGRQQYLYTSNGSIGMGLGGSVHSLATAEVKATDPHLEERIDPSPPPITG